MKPKKQVGGMKYPPRMLKNCDDSIMSPIQIIVENCTRESGKCPMYFQCIKKKSKIRKDNYRPISLFPIPGIMFEKVLFDSLYAMITLLVKSS